MTRCCTTTGSCSPSAGVTRCGASVTVELVSLDTNSIVSFLRKGDQETYLVAVNMSEDDAMALPTTSHPVRSSSAMVSIDGKTVKRPRQVGRRVQGGAEADVRHAQIVEDGAVWPAKNSDREPGEAQAVEHHLRTRPKQASPPTRPTLRSIRSPRRTRSS